MFVPNGDRRFVGRGNSEFGHLPTDIWQVSRSQTVKLEIMDSEKTIRVIRAAIILIDDSGDVVREVVSTYAVPQEEDKRCGRVHGLCILISTLECHS